MAQTTKVGAVADGSALHIYMEAYGVWSLAQMVWGEPAATSSWWTMVALRRDGR